MLTNTKTQPALLWTITAGSFALLMAENTGDYGVGKAGTCITVGDPAGGSLVSGRNNCAEPPLDVVLPTFTRWMAA